MSSYSIPPLISSILFLYLGLFCYLRNKTSKINLAFALMCLTTVWWQGSWAILFNVKDPNLASILVRVGYSGIIFISITFYHFTVEFLNRREERKLVWISYALGVGFLISLWTTNLFIRGYYSFYWGYYPKASFVLHPVYLTMLSAHALRILYLFFTYLKKKQLEAIKRNQIKYIFWAIFFYALASVDFADNYGLELYPLGFIPLLIFLAIIGHTIVKYRLLDIHFVIKKAVTNFLLIMIVSCVVWTTYYPRINWITLSLGFIIACLGVVYIPKLKLKTENAVNHILYKEKYKYQEKLEDFIEQMVTIPQEQDLFEDTIRTLGKTLGVTTVAIFILDPNQDNYFLKTQIGLDRLGDGFRIQENGMIEWLKDHRTVCIKEEMEKILTKEKFASIQEVATKLNASACVPAMLKDVLIGFITLGEKGSGDIYSHIDIRILHRLGTQLAVSLNYKQMEAKLREQHALGYVATMAKELSHQFRNRFVTTKTYFDMLPEKQHDKFFTEEYTKLVLQDVNAISHKLTEMMFFANLEKPRPKYSPVDLIVKAALILVQKTVKEKNIEVNRTEEKFLPQVFVDEQLITSALSSILDNAAGAVPEDGGRVEISTDLLHEITKEMKQKSDQWLRITIKDNGSGIPKKTLDKIFEPFFTTRSGGAEVVKMGLGLGLVTSKMIVEAHGGDVRIYSEENKGTIVDIDLPVANKELLEAKNLPPEGEVYNKT